MTRRVAVLLVVSSCYAGADTPELDAGTGIVSVGITTGATTGGAASTDDGPDGTEGGALDETGGNATDDDDPLIYDVGAGVDTGGDGGVGGDGIVDADVDPVVFCAGKGAGIHCDVNAAVTCDGAGQATALQGCGLGECVDGTGCTCEPGQFDCQGANVMACNDAVDPPTWHIVQICPANVACRVDSGSCDSGFLVGDTTPTGVYYQYAFFTADNSEFLGVGYSIDGFGNDLYVLGGGLTLDIYEIELLDSDGDGLLEPSQHPDNPDHPGAIEERALGFLETLDPSAAIPMDGVGVSSAELFVAPGSMFIAASSVRRIGFDASGGAVTTDPVGFIPSHLGFDDVNKVWYASSETRRYVYQFDEASQTWGIAFAYPSLAGSHMDGLEVVTHPDTGIPYVYVSDMTSDFIAQYRKDPEQGWVQENLFSYDGTASQPVEGMGFGPLGHFWAASGAALYEIGGGDLDDYVDDPDPPPPPG